MARNWFAIVENDDDTGNPTLEVSGQGRGVDYTTVSREITVEEMLLLGDALISQAQQIKAARARVPGWEKRAYHVE